MRAVVVLLLAATVASAQVGAPYDRPAGFGQRFGPPPVVVPPPLWGYPVYYPFNVFPPASSSSYYPTTAVPVAPPAVPPLPTGRLLPVHYLSDNAARARAAEVSKQLRVTTRLTLELPAAAEVWVNGTKQPGAAGKTHALTADLGPGESHTFNVVAKWTTGGKAFEYTKTATLDAGDTKTVTVFAGTPVPAK